MANGRLIQGPHLLWVGSNGRKTYGITVESTQERSEVEQKGYQRRWNENDHSILTKDFGTFLGMTAEEVEAMRAEIRRLVAEQA